MGGHRFFSKDESINRIWLDILNSQGETICPEIEEPQFCSYYGNADPNVSDDVMILRRNGQHRYNNMDHYMLTGIYALKYINGQAPIDVVWDVNTKQDYHEEGSEKNDMAKA